MVRNGKKLYYAFNHKRYIDLVKSIIIEDKLEFRAPLLKKGDVLFWNSKTIHGSLKTTRPELSRSSLTAHYIPSSHQFLQFQSIIKPLKIKEFEDMAFHCPKDLDKLQNRAVLAIETTFPKTFQKAKKLAIKAMVR
jgi:phytanoyl-CoA hydroxylase